MNRYRVHGYFLVPFEVFVEARDEDHADELVYDMPNRRLASQIESGEKTVESIVLNGKPTEKTVLPGDDDDSTARLACAAYALSDLRNTKAIDLLIELLEAEENSTDKDSTEQRLRIAQARAALREVRDTNALDLLITLIEAREVQSSADEEVGDEESW